MGFRSFVDAQDGARPDAVFAAALVSIGSEARLEILRQLRTPKPLRDIEVRAPDPDRADGRPISRQAVRVHLEKLVEIGVVTTREVDRSVEYVLNHQRLFAIAEEFRALARLRPAPEVDAPTVGGPSGVAGRPASGPRLVLVRGLDEGTTWSLAEGRSPRRWVVGRKRGLDVALDFDPFVSSENAVVSEEAGRFFVADLPESRNGTTLNFALLGRGERRELAAGDVIGVGRSLLLFRT